MPIDATALTRDLIRFRTINPPGEEEACARHLGRLLEDAGFRCDYVMMGAGRANLIARLGGSTDSPPLAFTGHIDVVPLGARAWSMDPFAADTADNRIYGRGASDMKSGVAAFVAAAIEAAPGLAPDPACCSSSPPARKPAAPAHITSWRRPAACSARPAPLSSPSRPRISPWSAIKVHSASRSPPAASQPTPRCPSKATTPS